MQEYASAVRVLLRVADGRSLDQAIQNRDSALARQISYGVLRHFYYLSACLEQLLSKPLADKHHDLELLIMAGIYSIDHLNRPAHASVNFAVDCAVSLKKPWAKKLVNGVLRNYQRKKDSLIELLADDEEAQTNHPDWLTSLIKSAYQGKHEAILRANQSEPPMTLRVNLGQTTREQYLDKLTDAEMPATPGQLSPASLYLHKPVPAEQLPAFAEGAVSIQDEASQLVPQLLNLQPGHRVLDACAAPGGKSCAMLEVNDQVDLTAIDQDARRIERINDNLKRLKLSAAVLAESLQAHNPKMGYDRILLDVPCSATGIIRRHPDIKLLRLPSDIAKLVATQEELLAKAWSLLNEDGELVYSTCSILPGENREVVEKFVKNTPSARFIPIELPHLPGPSELEESGLQLLPQDRGTDGFFFARLKKVAP
jgi:16S rRNA (cytosine967-C5)-methyltransferase